MTTEDTVNKLKEIKLLLHPKLEYLADTLIDEFEGFGRLSEYSLETANDLIERSGA